MATATAFMPFDMEAQSIWSGNVTTATPTFFSITDGFRQADYYGDFTYPGGFPTGNVTRLDEWRDGNLLYSITGADVDFSSLASASSFLDASSIIFDGADTFIGSDGGDNLFSFDGDDIVSGGLGNDTLNGGAGNDQLIGGDGEDTLTGGEGNDILKGGIGADLLYGGSSDPSLLTIQDQGQLFDTDGNVELGTDFFSQSITAGVSGNLAAIEVQYETLDNVETIEYSLIAGGNPADGTLLFSEVVAEPDLSSEGVFRWSLPDLPELFFEEGEQFTFSFQAETAGVVFAASDPPDYVGGELYEGNNLSDQAGDIAFLTFVRAEDLSDAKGDDRLYGDEGNDTLNGGSGNDRLIGGEGVDTLNGGEGNDVLIDRAGVENTLNGGAGEDRIVTSSGADFVTGGSDRDVIKTFGGADVIYGDEGNDVILSGTENDTVYGGDGDDVIKTSLGDDYVEGGDGNDIIYTWRGNDTAIGGAGDDTIRGDFDDDTIEGGAGNDRLIGAPGRDTFVFREGFEEDRILDFWDGSDLLDFSQHTGVESYDDLSISQVSSHVVITDGLGGRVVLADTDIANISEADFVFVA